MRNIKESVETWEMKWIRRENRSRYEETDIDKESGKVRSIIADT